MTEVVKISKQKPNFTFFIKFEDNLGVKKRAFIVIED